MNVAGYEPGYESDPNDDSPFANPLGAATRTFDATAKPAGETSNPFSAELGLGSALVGARSMVKAHTCHRSRARRQGPAQNGGTLHWAIPSSAVCPALVRYSWLREERAQASAAA